jgi:predicted enzyme related to lactoylglutathione lyase
MTFRSESWPPGRPAWAELTVPDRHAARDFYSAVFGWDYTEGGPETGYYTTALKGSEPVAAIGEPMPGQSTPFQWTTYLATDDVSATVDVAQANGATVLAPAMDVMEFGRMAIIADPTGAVVGLWQSGTHTGFNVVDEPGTVVWTEQMSRDLEAAKSFFSAVFGYTYTDMSSPEFRYVTFEIDGVTAGGLGELSPEMGETPPHWLTYFGVEDTDAASNTLVEHGGSVLKPAWDTPFGRIAVVAGPVGEVFAIIAAAQERPADS